MKRTWRFWLSQAGIHLALAVGAVIIILPFAVMLWTAFVPQRLLFDGGANLRDLTLANFRTALGQASWGRYYRNSLITTAAIFLAQLATCLPAAYVLARCHFRGKRGVLWLVLACLIAPPQAIAIPNYVLLARGHLLDSLAALIIPFLTSAFGIFLFRQFILTIPQPIFDAARLDGVGDLGMVWRIVLPNVRPAILAFGVFIVTSAWNDLFWPSVVLQRTENATVPLGITRFAEPSAGNNYGAQMAAAVLAILPLIVTFVVAQRQILKGIALIVDP